MRPVLRHGPLWSLLAIGGRQVRRHPYLTASIVLHALLLGLMFYIGSYVIELKRQEKQVSASVQLAKHTRTEKRVHDMEAIKSLLEQSAAKAPTAGAQGEVEEEVQFSATSLPKQPDELLKQAKELSKSIDEIEKNLKAEELAKLLDIPKEKALEQLGPPPAASKPAPTAARPDPARIAEEIKQLEGKARAALIERLQALERQDNGMRVEASAAANAPGGTGGENGGADKGRGAAGEGKGRGGAGGGDGGAMRTQIAAFINRDVPQAKISKNYGLSDDNMFDPGTGSIPAARASELSKGVGKLFGAGGEYANRVYVNSWYLIGPFDGKHGRDMFSNYSHPPEQSVLLDAVYFGKGKRLLKWHYVSAENYPLVPPDMADDAVYYGYTELMFDQAQDLTMWVGADDDVQVWLNERVVWTGGNVNKSWFFNEIYNTQHSHYQDFNLSEGKRLVHFKKGRNKVFFKLSNGPNGAFLSMVLTK